MEQISLELYLPQLAETELMISTETFDQFQKAVLRTLDIRSQYAWEDEILKLHGKTTMDEVAELNAVRYVDAGKKERDGQLENAWFDTWAECYITQKDKLYSAFFVYKIRHIDLLDMDDFLNYQLSDHFKNDFTKFCRMLTLALRKYSKFLLTNDHLVTATEWAQHKDKEIKSGVIDEEKTGKLKGRPNRTGDDKLTALNQEQTVLLIHLLQRSKIFFQGDFLTNKQAGQAFHILTGYSADTIRQKLANTELNAINNKKNLTDLDNIFCKD